MPAGEKGEGNDMICKHCKERLTQEWADNLIGEKNVCRQCWWDLRKHGYALQRYEIKAQAQMQKEKDEKIAKKKVAWVKKQRAIRKQKKTKEFRALFVKSGG